MAVEGESARAMDAESVSVRASAAELAALEAELAAARAAVATVRGEAEGRTEKHHA